MRPQRVKVGSAPVRARECGAIAVFDVLTHAADIAIATGQTIEDSALVETALEVGQQMIGPDLRVPGIFGAEQSAPEGASPVVRLLAFAGRKV